MPNLAWTPGHAAGLCDLIYDAEGKHVITCGSEGEIHVRSADTGELVKTVECARATSKDGEDEDDAGMTSLDTHTLRGLAIGTDTEQIVKLHSSIESGCKFEKNVTRCTASVRQVAFSPTGLYLAVASDECDIRLINMVNTKQVITLKGHDGPVKSVAWDPKGEFLASTSEDGTMKVWNISSRKVVYTYNGLKIELNAPTQLCRPAWSPIDGAFLAVPSGRAEDVLVLKRRDWVVDFALSGGHRSEVDVVSWSPNGLYMLSGGLDGEILLWDIKARETLGKYDGDAQSLSLKFSPTENAFAAIDMDGRFAIRKNPIPSHMPPPTNGMSSTSSTLQAKGTSTQTHGDDETKTMDGNQNVAEADEEVPKRKKLKKKKKALKDQIASLKEELGLDHMNEISEEEVAIDDDSDDDMDEEDDLLLKRANERAAQWASLPPPPVRSLQFAIQPGSTPMRDDRRFLVWNNVGSIVSREEDTFCSIEIDFSDRSKHRMIRMTDHYRFTMAALNDRGALFASEGDDVNEEEEESFAKRKKKQDMDEDERVRSTVYYRPFETWTHNADWTAQLPKGEKVTCVAVGDSWAAVSTSTGMLRIWRFSGLQHTVMQMPGPTVCLTGHGSHLALVYRSGVPSDSRQHLNYEVLDVAERKQVCAGTLPMRAKAKLEWMGFSDRGTLMAYEDSGRLYGLYSHYNWKWVPLCDTSELDTTKKSNGHHWVIGATCGQLMTVLCVNGRTFPETLPKPVPCATPLRLPTLQTESKAGALEEEWLRMTFEKAYGMQERDMSTKEQVKMDKICLQMMQIACKADRLSRALDAAMRLKLRKSFDIAVGLAQRMGQSSLAERVSLLIHARARALAQETIAEQQLSVRSRLELARKKSKSRDPLADLTSMRGDENEEEAEFDMEDEDDVKPSFSKKRRRKQSRKKKVKRKKKTTPNAAHSTNESATSPDKLNIGVRTELDLAKSVVAPAVESSQSTPTTTAKTRKRSDSDATPMSVDAASKTIGTPVRSKKKRTAVNPFMRKTFASPKKAKDIFEAVKKSPLKTPVLSRQSSFSIAARANRKRMKRLLG